MIDPVFMRSIAGAVQDMRKAEMSDTVIALVVQDIRAATLNEEFRRLQELVRLNPPQHDSWTILARKIKEWIPS